MFSNFAHALKLFVYQTNQKYIKKVNLGKGKTHALYSVFPKRTNDRKDYIYIRIYF